MKHLLAGGRRVEYAWHGPPPEQAPTLVFLHEGLGSVSAWRDFPARLAADLGLGALVYSRAGYGGSERAELPRPVRYMHDEASTTLPDVLDTTGVRDAVLVGHSDGGSIAILHAGGAARGSERVRALALESPHVFVEDVSVRSIAAVAEAYRATDLRARLERHHGAQVDDAFWGWNRVWLDPAFRAWNIEAYLRGVRVPTLVVQGEDDEYGTLAQVRAIETQSGGPVERCILDHCGHAPHRDQPERTRRAIVDFVQRVLGVM